jgi:hypothetical protein
MLLTGKEATSVLFTLKMLPNLRKNCVDASLHGSLSGLHNFSRSLKERGEGKDKRASSV